MPSAQESPFVLEEEEELDLDPEEPQSPTQQTTGVDRSAKALERFMNESISLDDSLDRLLSEMKYKMEFQDTHQLSNRLETVIDENDNLAQNLTPYGLQTSMIDNGIQIEIDTTKTKALKLLLKNDGSLTLITDSYQAEINSDLS